MPDVTPAEFESIAREWDAFELLEFPPDCEGREVEGEAFEDVDAIAAGCVSVFLSAGGLDAECTALLAAARRRLGLMADLLPDGEAKGYFARFAALADRVLTAAGGHAGPPDTP